MFSKTYLIGHKESYQIWCNLVHRVQICPEVKSPSLRECGFIIINYGIDLFMLWLVLFIN